MANETVAGKKMSEYDRLTTQEKDYFINNGDGSVVTVGKVVQGGNNVNRLVKLKDLAVQADWNETNSAKPGFIKNQPKFTVDSREYVLKGIKVGTGLKLTVDDETGVVTIDTAD